MARVLNTSDTERHIYEDREARVMYVWPPGEERDVPDAVAALVTEAHPVKLRIVVPMERTEPVAHRHYFRRDGFCRCGEKELVHGGE